MPADEPGCGWAVKERCAPYFRAGPCSEAQELSALEHGSCTMQVPFVHAVLRSRYSTPQCKPVHVVRVPRDALLRELEVSWF